MLQKHNDSARTPKPRDPPPAALDLCGRGVPGSLPGFHEAGLEWALEVVNETFWWPTGLPPCTKCPSGRMTGRKPPPALRQAQTAQAWRLGAQLS